MVFSDNAELSDLLTINQINETLNLAVNVRSVLDEALVRLLDLVGLEAGWIFLLDENDNSRWAGRGFQLAAHHGLPPGMALDSAEAWDRGCDCQALCQQRQLRNAYNEVRCSRLGSVSGEIGGLAIHASVPLRSGPATLGILNVAAPDWAAFSARALALLTNVGIQMGVALERAQLFDLVQEQRIHEQKALLDFTNQMLSSRRLGELLTFLVNEVCRLLQVDACALLLPDEDNPGFLRFAAAAGWHHDPVAHGRRVPASSDSASGRAMLNQEPIVREDLSNSAVLPWMHEWLMMEKFLGAAIVPLVSNGQSIGTLVVDSRHARRLTSDELRFLQLMANQAALAIETARLHEEELQRQRLEDELEVSRRIQLSMLPPSTPRLSGWSLAAYYQPAKQVGGDFYDFYRLPKDEPDGDMQLGLIIADVADKGVPAALFMALCRTTLRSVTHAVSTPAAALETANRIIFEEQQSDLFFTAFYGLLNPASGRLRFANAGHNPPLKFSAAGEVVELNVPGIALSVLGDITLHEAEVVMQPGDYLVMYTDGVTEAMNDQLDEFGVEGVISAVAGCAGEPSEQILERILTAAIEFSAGYQHDDFTLVILKRLAGEQPT